MPEQSVLLKRIYSDWQQVTSMLKREPFDDLLFITSINNLNLMIKNYAYKLGKEHSIEFTINIVTQAQEKYPPLLTAKQENQLGSIITGFMNLTTERGKYREIFFQNEKISDQHGKTFNPQDIRGIYSYQLNILRAIVLAQSKTPKEENKEYEPNYSIAKKILDLCLTQRSEYQYFKNLNCEEKFIELTLKIIIQLCNYVKKHPVPTYSHRSHNNIHQLLLSLEPLLIERDIPVIDRAIMLLEKTVELNTNKKSTINEVLDTIKVAFFKDDHKKINDFSFLQSFKFSSVYSLLRDGYYTNTYQYKKLIPVNKDTLSSNTGKKSAPEYKKYRIIYDPIKAGVRSSKTTQKIKAQIDKTPYYLTTVHLAENKLHPSFFGLSQNVAKTDTHTTKFIAKLVSGGFGITAELKQNDTASRYSMCGCLG